MGVLRARNFKKGREMRGPEFILGARGYAGRGRISRETEKRKEERITLGMEERSLEFYATSVGNSVPRIEPALAK